MKLLRLEIKRIAKSRLTICMVLVALAFSFLFAYVPITFFYCVNPSGDKEYLTGVEALKTLKEIRREVEGDISHEDIMEAVKCYQEITGKYGVTSEYSLPIEGKKEIAKYEFLIWRIKEAYGPENGYGADLNSLEVEKLEDFYQAVDKHLQNNMKLEQKDHLRAREIATRMYERVDVPYSYYVGVDSNVIEYEGLLIFMILLCCTVVASPVFSSDYQTGADDIMRCAKNGKRNLAVIKILASASITLGICITCLSVWGITTCIIWGTDGMRTSMQILFSVINLVNLDAGQLMWLLGICGTIMIISSVCLSLLISSCVSKNMVSLILAVAACLTPMILGWILPGEAATYAKALFPSGGIGIQNSILFDIVDFKFLNIGPVAIWTPYLIMFFAVAEIPLWIILTIKGYEKHVMH
jgi:hypothetical protein